MLPMLSMLSAKGNRWLRAKDELSEFLTDGIVCCFSIERRDNQFVCFIQQPRILLVYKISYFFNNDIFSRRSWSSFNENENSFNSCETLWRAGTLKTYCREGKIYDFQRRHFQNENLF